MLTRPPASWHRNPTAARRINLRTNHFGQSAGPASLIGTQFAFPTRGYEEAAGVLKITWRTHKRRGLTIRLEGEVFRPWVGSVRDACTIRGRQPRRLDLAAVTYVDAARVQLLRDLMAEGVEIAACSSFVRELLHLKP
jgi:hypothetical protein